MAGNGRLSARPVRGSGLGWAHSGAQRREPTVTTHRRAATSNLTAVRASSPETPARLAKPAGGVRTAAEAFLLLLGTHFVVDCFSSTLPTVQPLLVERFGLSFAQAGLLGGLWMFSSSVLQLPFGLLSDRLHSRQFTILSPVVAAVCLSAIGLASSIGEVIVLLLVGGMGVAAYHPHSTSQAGRIAGGRKAIGTAVFITVGTAGLGLGPLYLTAVVQRVGFEQLWLSAVPVLVLAPLLLWRVPQPSVDPDSKRRGVDWRALRKHSVPLFALYTLVVLRSIVQVGLAQFLALYMVQVRGAEFTAAGVALAAYFLSTSVGSFVGGAAAHRFGGCNVIIASCVGAGPLLAVFMATDGWLSILALFVGGVVLLASIPVNVVMAQDLVPSQAGATSALMMGFGWGAAGIIFVPAAGWLGDLIGLGPVLWGFTALPLLGLPVALRLRSAIQTGTPV